MGMSGRFDGLKPPTRLISGLYFQGNDVDEDGNRIDGFCAHCKNWDAELVDGHCRDEDCKHSRLDKKVQEGSAFKYSTDVMGGSGSTGTVIERGNKKYFVKRK